MDDTGIKREPVIRISYDRMEAYIMLPILGDNEAYTVDELMDAAAKNGVVFGIDCDLISDMVESRNFGHEICFARGQKPQDGEDGRYEFLFDYNLNKQPKILDDGSVDYWSVHSVEVVKKGQEIARYIEPVEGKDGKDVFGKVIQAKRGKPLPPLAGRGFEKSADGLLYVATIDGKIEKNKNRILINPVLEINGDVDVGTGNIDFIGDVIVHGSVRAGARIMSSQSITVDGICEGCVLEAGKDIILRSGMIGRNKARLIVNGNLFAKFIEYTEVNVEGYVEADSAVNCIIVSNDRVLFKGGHASIVGGKVYGCAGIEVANLGNDAFIKTEVNVGVHKKIKIKIAELERLIVQKQQLLDNITAGLKQIEMLEEKTADRENLDEKKMTFTRAKIEKTADIIANKEELGRLQSIVERSTNATVKVTERTYPNVEVCINNSKLVTKDEVGPAEFMEKDAGIVMMSL